MTSRKITFYEGDIIGEYRLTAECGKGGFGQVFLAENTISGHLVALKILFDVEAGNKELDGLKAFQQCRNEHLIQIHHIGKTDNGYLYYTMDRADNAGTKSRYKADSLDWRIKKGKLSPEEVFELAVHLAEALGCLHDAGLIHRDIKPANIIYVNRKPVLADIGLVTKSERPDVSFAGTPGFLPKYVYAGGHPPCRESDFYALGLVLWCALTGQCDPRKAMTANGTMTLSGHSGDLQRLCMNLQDDQDYDKITIRSKEDFLDCLNADKKPSTAEPDRDILDIISQNIPISYHPLMAELTDSSERETYLYSFTLVFAAAKSLEERQGHYLKSISQLFHCPFSTAVIEEQINDPKHIDLKRIRSLLSTEKRQNAWLADAVFLLDSAPQPMHEKIKKTIVEFMKTFNRNEKSVSELVENYLFISDEKDPSALWKKIETMPGNYSWKTILDFRKIAFGELWEPLIDKLWEELDDFSDKNWETKCRLQDNLWNYELVDPEFHLSVIGDFLAQCKLTRSIMTSDMNDLINNFNTFWGHYANLWRQANHVLYIFGEEQIDCPSFIIEFDNDYSSVNEKKWFESIKKAYGQYQEFNNIFSQKPEILRRQLKLYQQGKFTESAARLIAEEEKAKERKRQEEEKKKEIFEFSQAGKKYRLKVEYSEVENLPFEISHINSGTIAFFQDKWYLISKGLWCSKDCMQWEKVEKFAGDNCDKLIVTNNTLLAWASYGDGKYFFSEDGFNWNTGTISCKGWRMNIFHFADKWWISSNISHEYSYTEKGWLWDSERKGNGEKTVFFESDSLSGEWKESKKFSLSDGQIISEGSLLAANDKLLAIRSWDYSYHNDKHLPYCAVFLYSAEDGWYKASCSHELTRWGYEPDPHMEGVFLQTSDGIYCATDKGFFFSEDGQSWIKKNEDQSFYHPRLSTIDYLLLIADGRSLYIYESGCGIREFKPGFEFDNIYFENNLFIAFDPQNKQTFYGRFQTEAI